jgi:hypothetical protein
MNLPYEMALGNYRGGNDAWGSFPERGAETEATGLLQDAINPSLLEVRVTVPFTRRDGTPAELGEPLLKSRFPLSRLAWITHRGPSATLPTTDTLYNAEGTPEAIKACFGLEWTRDAGLAFQPTDAPGPPDEQLGYFFWKYDHSSPNGKVRPESIARLSSVADAGREPDFFELLKAGILVGSLGPEVLEWLRVDAALVVGAPAHRRLLQELKTDRKNIRNENDAKSVVAGHMGPMCL